MRKNTETAIQSKSFIWFNNNYCLKKHTPRYIMFVVPNETASTLAGILRGMRVPDKIIMKAVALVIDSLKSVGFLSGVSDNIIVSPNGVHFIEFKLDKQGVQSDKQKDFEIRVNELGHRYALIRSFDAFREYVTTHVVS